MRDQPNSHIWRSKWVCVDLSTVAVIDARIGVTFLSLTSGRNVELPFGVGEKDRPDERGRQLIEAWEAFHLGA